MAEAPFYDCSDLPVSAAENAGETGIDILAEIDADDEARRAADPEGYKRAIAEEDAATLRDLQLDVAAASFDPAETDDHEICVHAFVNDGDGSTYTNDYDAADGWTVYVRTQPDAGGKFEIVEEHDVPSRDDAIELARTTLMPKYGVDHIDEY